MGAENDPLKQPSWAPPAGWRRITTLDAHAAGEPFRVVVAGVDEPVGETILERREYARARLDEVRRGLMWEPRGHADMYGCLLTPPESPESDFGILFLHNEGYSTMCGHGILAVSTVVLESGMIDPGPPDAAGERELRIDTPAGTVTSWSRLEDGRVTSVRFRNVVSYVVDLGRSVEVEGLGPVRYDLAFGGAYYAYVNAADFGLGCDPAEVSSLIELARKIKAAVAATDPIKHPTEPELGFLYGVVFVAPARSAGCDSRNVCVFADGEVDRSPTGTSVSARLAIHHARGEIAVGEEIVIESLVGSRFGGRVVETTRIGPHPAIVPEVSGRAWLTGRHEFVFAPDDPFATGFFVR